MNQRYYAENRPFVWAGARHGQPGRWSVGAGVSRTGAADRKRSPESFEDDFEREFWELLNEDPHSGKGLVLAY